MQKNLIFTLLKREENYKKIFATVLLIFCLATSVRKPANFLSSPLRHVTNTELLWDASRKKHRHQPLRTRHETKENNYSQAINLKSPGYRGFFLIHGKLALNYPASLLSRLSPLREVFIHQPMEMCIMTWLQQVAELMYHHMLHTPVRQ